jgi:Arc/MetJ family transcription regulator
MTRTVIDIDDELLARAQRSLGTGTKKDTVNAALEAAAAMDVERRTVALERLRELAQQMDLQAIDADEARDHAS